LTGTTDFGAIITRRAKGDEDAVLAFDLFTDRILDFVGAYFLKLGGHVDALVFAGGIGERASELRRVLGERVACIGFAVDDARNDVVGKAAEGGVTSIGDRVLVCWTDEQVSSRLWNFLASSGADVEATARDGQRVRIGGEVLGAERRKLKAVAGISL
jgi:acetate kinase